MTTSRHLLPLCCLLFAFAASLQSTCADPSKYPFFVNNCNDCHADGANEGGLDLSTLSVNLEDKAAFARWERIFDRVKNGEMPPTDAEQPTDKARQEFVQMLGPRLIAAHAKSKGTVLRRLNRREYQNTINDMFGTNVQLVDMLPADGRSHEFDNVGEALGLSMVHLQRYMEAATLVLDTAIAKETSQPEVQRVEVSYRETREGEEFIGKVWRELEDGAVVRFSGGGYPSGMLRGTGTREAGRYRIRVTGYAYQSEKPIAFSVGGTSFARGSKRPIYGFWSFAPGKPGLTHSVEFETWIENKYMLAIEPYGIADPDRYQRKSIAGYEGPGLAILKVTMEGPLCDEWPSRGHQLVLSGLNRREIEPRNPAEKRRSWYKPKFEIVCEDEAREVRQALTRVAQTAFRRSVSTEEVKRYTTLYTEQRSAGSSVEEALRTAVAAILCSPNFLYLQEPTGVLDDTALANRLSYFLTRTAPDKELRTLAQAGKLTSSESLRQQTDRLLQSPHFDRFVSDFADNWLDLRDIDFTMPDRTLFPEFDEYLRYSMPRETHAYLQELIRSNLPVANLVKSNFAMLNSRLAKHYDLPAVEGSQLRKVTLPTGSVRGGFLTQASVLKVTANGTNTSPVTRGAWVLERILGTPPPPPPPGIPGVEPDIRGAETLRQLLDKHRNLPACSSCHQKIDPPGFALESFNPIGGFRKRYRSIGNGERIKKIVAGRNVGYRLGPAVDSSGEFANGTPFTDFAEFRSQLAADQKVLAHALAEKLLTFATGRELGFSDRAELERIVSSAEEAGFGVRDLIQLVVQSRIFRHK